MKVRFCCDNNANSQSKKWDEFDVEKDLRLTIDEWKALTAEEKNSMVREWAFESFEYWIEEDDE